MKIFETVHGSHLYGFAHEGSDVDLFRVTDSTRMKSIHKYEDGIDVTEMGVYQFMELAYSGSHQSVEALFSRQKVWYSDKYRSWIEGSFIRGPEVYDKYSRTIKKFSFGSFKKRRHAARLSRDLYQLRKFGRFNPELKPFEITLSTEYATLFEGDELLRRLH